MTAVPDRLMEDFAADEAAERAHYADLVALIAEVEDGIKTIEKSSDLARKRDELKQWLALNEGPLDSPDGGYVARLQDRSTTEWDLRPLADDQIVMLARAGMLTVKTGAFKSLMEAAPSTVWDDICAKPGVRNEGMTTALLVRKNES